MNSGPEGGLRTGWLAALSCTGAGICCAAVASFRGASPNTVALFVAASFFPYALLWSLDVPEGFTAKHAMGFAGALGLILAFAPPLLSDDIYRYLWDGRVLLSGQNPYRFAPDHHALYGLRDEAWLHINHAEVPTIYPPVAQLLFALGGLGGLIGLKLVCVLAHISAIPAAVALAGGERRGRVAVAVAANPLLLAESGLSGHVDMVVGACIAWALVCLQRSRTARALALAVAAAGIKLVGIALLPLFWARRPRASDRVEDRRRARGIGGLVLLLATAMFVAVLSAGGGGGGASGLGQYGQRWAGNAGGFVVVERGVRLALESSLPVLGDKLDLRPIAPALELAADWGLDPRDAWAAPKKASPPLMELETTALSRAMARVLVALIWLALAVVLWWRRATAVDSTRILLLAALLLAPQIHPWYLLWLLPLEIAAGGALGLVWSAVILVAYAPLDAWAAERVWAEQQWAVASQYALLALVSFVAALRGASLLRAAPHDETGHEEDQNGSGKRRDHLAHEAPG